MRTHTVIRYLAAAIALITAASAPYAQTWPAKPISILVPLSPGGPADTVTRLVAQEVSGLLNTPVLVENRTGAAGRIMMSALKRAQPDGYTLGYYSTTAIIVAATSQAIDYDIIADYTPVSLMSEFYGVLVVASTVPTTDIPTLIAYLKANPGKASYGSHGIGSQNHLFTERFKSMTGTQFVHVPYKGDTDIAKDLANGSVQLAFMAMPPSGLVDAGKVRVLATTGPQRWLVAPNAPTLVEAGYPSLISRTWSGVAGPRGIPADVVQKLSDVFIRAVKSQSVQKALESRGYIVRASSADVLARTAEEDLGIFRKIASDLNIRLTD